MDNGFTKIPNRLFDAILAYGFTETQLHVVLYIIRKTEGWNKPSDVISIAKMGKDIRKRRQHLSSVIADLEKMNVITVERSTNHWKSSSMCVNDPDDWEITVTENGQCPKNGHVQKMVQSTVPKNGQGMSEKCDSTLYQKMDTQKTSKDTHQKKEKEIDSTFVENVVDDDDDEGEDPDEVLKRIRAEKERRRNGIV